MPKLSIITVNHNRAEGLRKTIESVVNQTDSEHEYLIIDGGSTDGSLEVINNYSNRISYFISEKDHGIYDAMNKGIIKSKGEWIFFLNSGDTFNKTNILKSAFANGYDKNAQIVYGNTVVKETVIVPLALMHDGNIPNLLEI